MHIEHMALWTPDLERSRAFYQRYFGACANARYQNPHSGFQSYFLQFAEGARLELMQMPGIVAGPDNRQQQHTGWIHLAFTVGSRAEVDALTARLIADGYPCLDGPRETGDGYYESCVADPDGNRLEITA